MKNILLPIDFYGDSRQNLKTSLSFLKGMEGPLHVFLLKTYTVPVFLSDQVIDTHDKLQSESLEKLEKELVVAKELAKNGSMSFKTLLQMGKPANVVSRIVKERAIDCVVLGAAENSAQREDAIDLLNRIHCPVVVLPSPAYQRG